MHFFLYVAKLAREREVLFQSSPLQSSFSSVLSPVRFSPALSEISRVVIVSSSSASSDRLTDTPVTIPALLLSPDKTQTPVCLFVCLFVCVCVRECETVSERMSVCVCVCVCACQDGQADSRYGSRYIFIFICFRLTTLSES